MSYYSSILYFLEIKILFISVKHQLALLCNPFLTQRNNHVIMDHHSVRYFEQSCSFPESNFYYEESCGNGGGACVLEKECPHKIEAEYQSLCPSQKDQGAVCCKDCK